MLVRVAQQKFVLGRSIYTRGDIFECPEPQAVALTAVGSVAIVRDTALRATRAAPLAPHGLSMSGKQLSNIPIRARPVRE